MHDCGCEYDSVVSIPIYSYWLTKNQMPDDHNRSPQQLHTKSAKHS